MQVKCYFFAFYGVGKFFHRYGEITQRWTDAVPIAIGLDGAVGKSQCATRDMDTMQHYVEKLWVLGQSIWRSIECLAFQVSLLQATCSTNNISYENSTSVPGTVEL